MFLLASVEEKYEILGILSMSDISSPTKAYACVTIAKSKSLTEIIRSQNSIERCAERSPAEIHKYHCQELQP